jgi:hypothetical protein
METKKFKEYIKTNFGSIERFSKIAGIPKHAVWNALYYGRNPTLVQNKLSSWVEIAEKLKGTTLPKEWKDEYGEKIRYEIYTQYTSAKIFCSLFDLDPGWLTDIMNNKNKKITPASEKLFRILDIKL